MDDGRTMEGLKMARIPLTSSTMELSRRMIASEVFTLCPVLIGTYTVDENGAAMWAGQWAMLETEYANGITSLFEMKSKASKVHTALLNLDGHGDNVTDEDENQASPLPNDVVKETCVMERTFEGFFQIQTLKGKPNTVPEKDVVLSFYKCDVDHAYLVRGQGENRFGVFTLQGVLDETTKEMRLYKAYKPKDKTPVAKRTRPKPAASITKLPAAKKSKKGLSTPMSEYNSSAPGTPDVEITHVIPPNNKLSSVISISSGSSSPLISSRNRSERKRVVPAHLRDDASLDRDRAPAMRKCLSILKALMANPKAAPFLVPVDPVALGIPDYFSVIKDPMDLGTIRSNFEYGVYAEPDYFADHIRLVFNNAMLYNAPHTQVYVFAQKLLEDFEKKYKSAMKNDGLGSNKSRKYANLSDGEGSVDSNSARSKKSKRASLTKNQEIQSLKQEIEKMKVIVQEMASSKGTPPQGTPVGGNGSKPSKPRPFKMQDMTEEYLSKPMTAAEKHKLTADLKELPQEKLSRVLQIISETVPLHTITQGDDEVELDFNMFDTRCLRMIEGYVREQNIAKKRKRPPKRPTKGASESRLQFAKEAAQTLKSRQEQLKSQLAAMQGEVYVPSEDVVPTIARTIEQSSSGSSSDSSSSSDDDSDSSSDSDTERPLEKVSSYHF